jgi:hypothetical protein
MLHFGQVSLMKLRCAESMALTSFFFEATAARSELHCFSAKTAHARLNGSTFVVAEQLSVAYER